MGNKPSNTTGGPAIDTRRPANKGKRSTLSVKHSGGHGGAPVVPVGPKNYVDMGFPEEDPTSGRSVSYTHLTLPTIYSV